MNAKQLKKAVLQYAFKGKLSDRKQTDTPVENILNQMKEIKNKEVSLKIDDTLLDNPTIPKNWKWISFGEITFNKDSNRIPLSKNIRQAQQNKVYPYYGASGIIDYVDNYLFEETLLLIGEDGANLVNRSTPIAFLAQGKYWVNNHAHVIGALNETLLIYIMHYINSISLIPYITGTAQPKMNQKKLNSIPIPIPPIEEQRRIIGKIEELFLKIDSYDTHFLELEVLNKRFPKDLEKSILQYAIEGKLVEQDTSDEPASELLKRISEQKEQMVKEKIIKKEKALPPIIEEEIPFDIPDTWAWARLGNLVLRNIGGGTPSKSIPEYWNGSISWASVKDLKSNIIDSTQDTITELGLEKSSSNLIEKGNLIVCTRMGLGKIAINQMPIAINQDLRALYLPAQLEKEYIIYYFKTLTLIGKGATVKGINLNELNSLLIPVPPLTEQRRIVSKIKKMFLQIEKILSL